jgi:hypothetical protein
MIRSAGGFVAVRQLAMNPLPAFCMRLITLAGGWRPNPKGNANVMHREMQFPAMFRLIRALVLRSRAFTDYSETP